MSWAALLLLAAALPASAHEQANHGTIKVHDDETVSPPTRNDPHVSCDFWVEGFNMTASSGDLVFTEKPPTAGSPPAEVTTTWTSDSGNLADGFHFNAGPLNLTAGHWKVQAFVDAAEPHSHNHSSKSKVFWVDACNGPTPGGSLPCPGNVQAEALANGNVRLTWDAVAGADSYNLYRADDGGDSEFLDSTTSTTFTDTTTVTGHSYDYRVVSFDATNQTESARCPAVHVTAVPFFPGEAGIALAGLGTLAAFMVLRRRGA